MSEVMQVQQALVAIFPDLTLEEIAPVAQKAATSANTLIAKKRSIFLRTLIKVRTDTGLSQSAVARRLHWSINKVNRIENNQSSVSYTDVLALIHLYNVTDKNTRDILKDGAKKPRDS